MNAAQTISRARFTLRADTPVAATVRSSASTSAGVIFAAGRSPSAAMTSPAVVPVPRLCGVPGSARSDWWERIVEGLAPRTFSSHSQVPVRELAERDAACAALALDALCLVEVLDVGADELGGGHVRPPLVEVPVGHAAAARPPTACVVPGQPRPSDAPLHLVAAVAELRLVVHLAALLDGRSDWRSERGLSEASDEGEISGVPAEYHSSWSTTLSTKLAKNNPKAGLLWPKSRPICGN